MTLGWDQPLCEVGGRIDYAWVTSVDAKGVIEAMPGFDTDCILAGSFRYSHQRPMTRKLDEP